MFRSLVRTLPYLTGNVQLACKITDIIKIDNDTYDGYVRNAELRPLQTDKYNSSYVNINLLISSYPTDINSYYKKYGDKFYDTNFANPTNDNKNNDFLVQYKPHQENKVRNTDYEFGCKRISYNANNYQFEFFAPFYIDDINDLPDHFQLDIKLNTYVSKTLRIKINRDNVRQNYLGNYLNRYISQLDNNIIFYNGSLNKFIYKGISINSGSYIEIAEDKCTSKLFKEQFPINTFDKTLAQGFKENKLICGQIIPISFLFNVSDILSSYDIKKFEFHKLNKITGQYVKGNKTLDIYDFDIDYINPNINYTKSLRENRLDLFIYDNKITPYYCKWMMALSDESNPYYINLSAGYNNMPQFKRQNELTTFENNNYILYDPSHYVVGNNVQINVDDPIINNFIKYHKWFNLIKLDNISKNDFFNKKNWNKCINNYAYDGNIMYNLNNLFTGNTPINIDYFGVFLAPTYNIVSNDMYKNTIYGNTSYTFPLEDEILSPSVKPNTFVNVSEGFLNFYIQNKYVGLNDNTYMSHNDIFEKGDFHNSDRRIYIAQQKINNEYVKISTIGEKNIELIDSLTVNNYDKTNLYVEGYIKINNLHYKTNINENDSINNYYYMNTQTHQIEQLQSLVNKAQDIDIYYKDIFINKNSIKNNVNESDIYELNVDTYNNSIFAKSIEIRKPIYYYTYNPEVPKPLNGKDMYLDITNIDDLTEFYLKHNYYNIYLKLNSISYDNTNINENMVKYGVTDIDDESDIEALKDIINTSKLYAYINVQEINSTHITDILTKNYTYYLYTTKNDDYICIQNKYGINNIEYPKLEILTPLYESVYKNEDEIQHQKNLINNGNICLYDTKNGIYKDIKLNDKGQIINYNRNIDQIVYIDDISYKYMNMVEIKSSDTINKIIEYYHSHKSDYANNYEFLYDIMAKIMNYDNNYKDAYKDLNDIIEKLEKSNINQNTGIMLSAKFRNYINIVSAAVNSWRGILHNNDYNISQVLLVNNKIVNSLASNTILPASEIIHSISNDIDSMNKFIYGKFITDNNVINLLNADINSNEFDEYLQNILTDIYINNYQIYANLANYVFEQLNISIYHMSNDTSMKALTINDMTIFKDIYQYIDTNNIFDNIILFDYDGKKYGAVFINKYIDNTKITYNLKYDNLFEYINGNKVTEMSLHAYFMKLLPYMNTNLFADFKILLSSNDNANIYTSENTFTISKRMSPTEMDNINIYHDCVLLKSGEKLYQFNEGIKNNTTLTFKRYMNYIMPVFKPITNNINIYELKCKDMNIYMEFGRDNIFKRSENINKYGGIYVFNDYKNPLIRDGKYEIKYDYEYKHFNDNSFYILKPTFEIIIPGYLTYDQLIENETNEIIYKYFSNYIKNILQNVKIDNNIILFLYNKYNVECHSTPMMLNFLKTKKLYKLKYIFNLI